MHYACQLSLKVIGVQVHRQCKQWNSVVNNSNRRTTMEFGCYKNCMPTSDSHSRSLYLIPALNLIQLKTVSRSTTVADTYIFGKTCFHQICHSDLGVHTSGSRGGHHVPSKKNLPKKQQSIYWFLKKKKLSEYR